MPLTFFRPQGRKCINCRTQLIEFPHFLYGVIIALLTVFVTCLGLGAIVGFLAGLLGIGGGLVIVPVLSVLLYKLNIVGEQPAFLVAVATSLASIIFTSFSSALTHQRHNNVDWALSVWVLAGVGVGAGLSSFLSVYISIAMLKTIFAVTVSFVALRMAFSSTTSQDKLIESPNKALVVGTSVIIGGLSSLIGIGGGALIVPMLAQLKFDVKKAIGVASVAGTCIAVVATVGYVSIGWQQYRLADWFLGYIYLPALLGLILTSSLFAPIGAKMVHRLPVKVLKRVFAAFLFVVVLRMLLV